jgi:hypothetical protein
MSDQICCSGTNEIGVGWLRDRAPISATPSMRAVVGCTSQVQALASSTALSMPSKSTMGPLIAVLGRPVLDKDLGFEHGARNGVTGPWASAETIMGAAGSEAGDNDVNDLAHDLVLVGGGEISERTVD